MEGFTQVLLEYIRELPALPGFVILSIVVLAVSILIGWFWKRVLIKFAEGTRTNLDVIFFRATGSAVRILFIALGLSFVWSIFGEHILVSISTITDIEVSRAKHVIDHLFYLFRAFAMFVLIWKATFSILDWYFEEYASRTSTKLDDQVIFLVRKILKVAFIVIFILIIADHFGKNLPKVWAAAGIGGIAVAFAARETIENIISGATILIDRPFKVGDRIELLDGTLGDVIDIGLRSTKILSFDNTIYILPNAEISRQRITNHAYPDFKIKVKHEIGVAYGTDMEKVKIVLNDILDKHPHVLNKPPWGIWFTDFGDSSLNLLIRYWVRNYKDKYTVLDEINMEIKRRFEEENIEIPFPQTDVHIRTK